MLHEAAHVAQQQDAARDPAQRAKPIGSEDQAAERAADHAANPGLAPTSSVGRTGLQLQRLPWDLPQQTPKDVGTRSIADKAAFIKRSMAEADEGWSRVVVDVFEQTDPAARITLQRQLDMERIGRSSSSTTASAMLWCSRSPPRRDFSGKDSGCVAMCTMVPAMLRWR